MQDYTRPPAPPKGQSCSFAAALPHLTPYALVWRVSVTSLLLTCIGSDSWYCHQVTSPPPVSAQQPEAVPLAPSVTSVQLPATAWPATGAIARGGVWGVCVGGGIGLVTKE